MNYVVGDIHGCYDALKKVLTKANFDEKKDYLYTVGDFCDRGNQNLKVVNYLMSLGDHCRSVFGNHDIWLYEYLTTKNANPCWTYNGGRTTRKEFSKIKSGEGESISNWLKDIPYIRVIGENLLIHNPVDLNKMSDRATIDITQVNLSNCKSSLLVRDYLYDEVVYDRLPFYDLLKESSISYSFTRDMEEWDFLSSINDKFPEVKRVVFGHTPLNACAFENKAFVYSTEGIEFRNLDSGAFCGGFLTLYCLDTGEIITSEKEKKGSK